MLNPPSHICLEGWKNVNQDKNSIDNYLTNNFQLYYKAKYHKKQQNHQQIIDVKTESSGDTIDVGVNGKGIVMVVPEAMISQE